MTYAFPDRDLLKGHPNLRGRWHELNDILLQAGFSCIVNEVWRSEKRQQWLYGQGRTPEACAVANVPKEFSRSGLIVTNAWSAATSAHGHQIAGAPAACALDVVPLGMDAHPWTADDPWDEFVSAIARAGADVGLVHFHAPGKQVWDKPHLQLIEWSDRLHQLMSDVGGESGTK